MPIDTSIPLRAYEGQFNPAAALQQGLQLRDMMQQSQARDMQFQDAAEARTEKRTLRDLMRGAVSPDGQIDPAKLRGAYAQTGNVEGLMAFDSGQAQSAAAARAAKAAEIKNAIDQVGYIAQLASGVQDEQSWRQALATAQNAGIDTAQYDALPYSPQLISTVRQQALTVGQQLEQEAKAFARDLDLQKFAYQRDNDALNRNVTIQGQIRQDRRAQESNRIAGQTRDAAVVKTTEAERTAGFLANRLAGALTDISAASAKSPNAAAPGIGEGFASLFGEQATNRAVSADRQQIRAAQLDALDAALTLGTGAAYTSAQLEGYRQSYFPALGDKPSTVAGKKARFLRLLESAAIKAGAATPPALVAAIEQGRSETTPKAPARTAPNKTPPAAAVAALRNGQGTPEQFDAIFGAGSAARYRKGR